ncbi:hypothetical protein ACU61A_34090 [Pseudonocardia sichuanensis]
MRFWTGRQSLDGTSVCYHDAWESVHGDEPGHTFTPENPLVRAGGMRLVRGRRIDYVLVRGGSHGPTLQVRSCERALVEPIGGVQLALPLVGQLVDGLVHDVHRPDVGVERTHPRDQGVTPPIPVPGVLRREDVQREDAHPAIMAGFTAGSGTCSARPRRPRAGARRRS